jgi:hypothetical protein
MTQRKLGAARDERTVAMATRHFTVDRLVSLLLWVGRVIAGVWWVVFFLSISAELASGHPPGGSTVTSVLNFASAALALVGVALSFWRAWVGGVALLVTWLATCLPLLLGLEPQTDVATGLVVGTIVLLLPGLLLVAAGMNRYRRVHAARGTEVG